MLLANASRRVFYDLVPGRRNSPDRLPGFARQIYEIGGFRCTLEGTRLVATPADPQQGQIHGLDDCLRAWAVQIEAETGFAVVFESAGSVELDASGTRRRYSAFSPPVSATPGLTRELGDVPTPVVRNPSPKLAKLYRHIGEYQQGRESLSVVAFYAVDLFQQEFGGRQQAANRMNVDHAVIDDLGKLTSKLEGR